MGYFKPTSGCRSRSTTWARGYSGLETIAKLKPTYLKIDIVLVRDVHTSLVNRAMVKAHHLARPRHRGPGHRRKASTARRTQVLREHQASTTARASIWPARIRASSPA